MNIREPASSAAEWGTVKTAVERANGLIGRSTLYQLIRDKLIHSRVIITHRHNVRGRRAIHLPSLEAFLAGESPENPAI